MVRTLITSALIIILLNLPVLSQIRIDLPFLKTGEINNPIQNENDSSLLLIKAAEQGDADIVLKLIDQGVDVDQTTGDGVTALMYAANNGHIDVIRILAEQGAEINAVPYNGITALSSACINNHYEAALFLLQQGANPEIPDTEGVTPLLYAVAYDYFAITELLLMFGAEPGQSDDEGTTPLHTAALYANPDLAWLLLDYGAPVDSRDDYGFTPLMMAVQLGRREMTDYLLDNNASVNLKTRDGFSVLAIAIANNHPKIAENLINLGANPKVKISYVDNLMNLAKWQGNEELIALMKRHGVRGNILPDFRTMRLSLNALVNIGDFLNGPQVSIEDQKYNLLLTAGWYTRPVRRAVLVEYSEDWHDQLWEQRHLFFGSIHKLFPVRYALGLNEDGFYAGINVMYSKGRYWGSYRYPTPQWNLVPSAGYYKSGSWWFYNIGYEYLDLNIIEKPAHRLRLGFGIRFGIVKDPVIYRTTYW